MHRWRNWFGERTIGAGIVCAAAELATAGGLPCGYSVDLVQQPCGSPFPDAVTEALGISPDGSIVVGRWMDCFFLADHAFIWRSGGFIETIPYPPLVTDMEAYDVNDFGEAVGVLSSTDRDGLRGFVHQRGRVQYLFPARGQVNCEALAINNNAIVAGWSGLAYGVQGQACTWERGAIKGHGARLGTSASVANDINDRGQITGWMGTTFVTSDVRAFVLDGDTLTILPPIPGGFTSRGNAINNRGHVCGVGKKFDAALGRDVTRAFLWAEGRIVELEVPDGYEDTLALDLSDDDVIVGYGTLARGAPARQAIVPVWHKGSVVDLDPLIIETEPMQPGVLQAISSTGVMVSAAAATGGIHAARLDPIDIKSADLDGDAMIAAADLAALLQVWGPCVRRECPADLDCNGAVDGYDLAHLLAAWSGS